MDNNYNITYLCFYCQTRLEYNEELHVYFCKECNMFINFVDDLPYPGDKSYHDKCDKITERFLSSTNSVTVFNVEFPIPLRMIEGMNDRE